MVCWGSGSQLHGKTYFRLEHYLPVSVLDKLEHAAVKEKLPRLHRNYYGVPEGQAELEFLKVGHAPPPPHHAVLENLVEFGLRCFF